MTIVAETDHQRIRRAQFQLVAVLFADPLHARPVPGHANKILWVAHSGGGPLTIRAQLEGSDQTAVRSVPDGPGPSIIDLPAAGCWRMTLAWSGHSDTLAIPYAP